MTKDAYFFNAQYDSKVSILRLEHGWLGYGVFWAVIEKLQDCASYQWPSSAKVGLKAGLCDSKTTLEQVEMVFATLESIGLIVDDGDYIFSRSLLTRMNRIDAKRQRLSEAGRRGVQARLKGGLGLVEATLK